MAGLNNSASRVRQHRQARRVAQADRADKALDSFLDAALADIE